MSKSFSVSLSDAPEGVVCTVIGRVDFESSPELLKALEVATRRKMDVKLNLSKVDYVDSSGIAVLIQGVRMARRSSVGFSLRGVQRTVMSVIELSQLQQFFDIERAEADQ